jgi:hypothetical protein
MRIFSNFFEKFSLVKMDHRRCDICNFHLMSIFSGHGQCMRFFHDEIIADGGKSMDIACRTSMDRVRDLVELGVDINMKYTGRTPVQNYVSSLNFSWIEIDENAFPWLNNLGMFFELGADPYILSEQGLSLFDMIPPRYRGTVENLYNRASDLDIKEPDCV